MTHWILSIALASTAFIAQADTFAEIETNYGTIKLTLDEKKAPKTVANFVKYAKKGFYDGTVFHRVIPGFMIQGGGFTPEMVQKTTDKAITNEASNGLLNQTGTIAMARLPAPHSATSQFFINLVDNESLNFKSKTPQGYGYAVFGKVTSGMDVVRKIARVKTGVKGYHLDVPVKPVIIKKVSIVPSDSANDKTEKTEKKSDKK